MNKEKRFMCKIDVNPERWNRMVDDYEQLAKEIKGEKQVNKDYLDAEFDNLYRSAHEGYLPKDIEFECDLEHCVELYGKIKQLLALQPVQMDEGLISGLEHLKGWLEKRGEDVLVEHIEKTIKTLTHLSTSGNKMSDKRAVTRVFGVFDTHGKFYIAYPRRVLADAYLCAHSKPENYYIKELGIEVVTKK